MPSLINSKNNEPWSGNSPLKTKPETGHLIGSGGPTLFCDTSALGNPPSNTEVAIIGNGPSAICLSFFLNGNWPFYNGQVHPNEVLQWHLSEIDPSRSLVEQDLQFLSEGLEGRSPNPVAVLFDALTSPNADLGDKLPSCLEFRQQQNAIKHAVFGKGAPGGSWNTIESSLLTVSAGSWMELPGADFETWHQKEKRSPAENDRVMVGDVSAYYLDYVRSNDLEKSFYSYTKVDSVKKVNPCSELVDSETGEEEICSSCGCYHSQKSHWEVWWSRSIYKAEVGVVEERGITKAQYVVLATGAHDDPRKLQVPGEDNPYVMHSFQELEDAIVGGSIQPVDKIDSNRLYDLDCSNEIIEESTLADDRNGESEADRPKVKAVRRKDLACIKTPDRLRRKNKMIAEEAGSEGRVIRRLERRISHICESSLPLVIVGAGLTAADAIISARSRGIPVVHVFRCKCNNSSLIFHNLPPALFPEYHNVFSMMNGTQDPESGGCQNCYVAFQGYHVSEFRPNGEVVIVDKETKAKKIIKCGGVLVCAGARPILNFLQNEGRYLGVSDADVVIDSSANPVQIDVFSYECIKEPNLFAMGPLVGDNFVRYLRGGALGITNSIWSRKNQASALNRKILNELDN